jgi:hypothetical protein
MIPEPTIGTAAALILGSIGAVGIVNGLRHAFIDEAMWGAIAIFVAYFILDMGAI